MSVRLPFVLVQFLVGWVLFTSVGSRGNPWPVVGAAELALGAYLLGRAVPQQARPWAALGLGVTALAAVLLGTGPLDGVLSGPLGYANANAALAAQAAGALAVAASATGSQRVRLLGILGVGAGLVICLVIGAAAATIGALLVLGALVLPGRVGLRISVLLSIGALLAGSVVALVVGAFSPADGLATRALTERRVALWSDGMEAIAADPLLGVGARDFAKASVTAARDSDTREAHAELLQRAVENGVPGLLLEGAAVFVVATGLARLAWRKQDQAPTNPSGAPLAAAGLATWAALWTNAGVDWILAFPALVGVAGLAIGLASPPLWAQPVALDGGTFEDRLAPERSMRDSAATESEGTGPPEGGDGDGARQR